MADGTADVAAKLINAQGIEAGSGEGIIRIDSIVAEVFIDRAVELVATRLGDGAYDRAEVAAIIAGVGTIDYAKFLHPVERGAGPLHAGKADGVIGSVQPEEGAMRFAQPTKAELEHGFKKRRLGCGGRTSAYIRGRGQQDEIDEVTAGNGKVGYLGGRDDLAGFHFFRVDGRGCGFGYRDGLLHCGDAKLDVPRTRPGQQSA